MKILYVEHDDDNLYMLKTRLERCGDFEVLAERSRRALRVHIGGDLATGLDKLRRAIEQALA